MATETLTCLTCGKEWTRESARGRKPRLCSECKEDPIQLKKQKELDNDAKWAAAQTRVDNLETSLKSRGNHLSQQRERRSYVISDLEERIHRLEEWRESLVGGAPIPEVPPADTKSEGVRKQRSRPKAAR